MCFPKLPYVTPFRQMLRGLLRFKAMYYHNFPLVFIFLNFVLVCRTTVIFFFLVSEVNQSKFMRQHAEKNPEFCDMLLRRAELVNQKHNSIINREEYIKRLDQVDSVLTEVEAELVSHSSGVVHNVFALGNRAGNHIHEVFS